MDTVRESSHVFLLPASLRKRIGQYDEEEMQAELSLIQFEIDRLAFELYGFTDADCGERAPAAEQEVAASESPDEESDDDGAVESSSGDREDLLSWAAGVAFGHFDWRLATGERLAPPEPDPFDPLPARSPAMLPEGDQPFHANPGILVDDPGHLHDPAHVIEEVLSRVDVAAPDDVRRWLQRDFFPFHLSRYSKSRRKAPIYWPLGTSSGSWSLWIYYPRLTSQTLYTAVNDFVEPKLKEVGEQLAALRGKGTARTRDDEKQFEALQSFNGELIELRDTLLKLAPTYKPNHDDGVQISAAPLWPLFRHKPWQKLLKETWAKLEKGEYDWAHLAMNYWPDRAREKCKTDKSLATAHGLENLYVAPAAAAKKTRSTKKKGADE
ncbi:Type II restriction enzyme [Variovorax sp. WDL1]|nr:Type II restriction enzyme [Variovorax sp. WDL1]